MKLKDFNDWWFNGGEEEADSSIGHTIKKADMKKQPSYPNEENAYSEALYEKAKKLKLNLDIK